MDIEITKAKIKSDLYLVFEYTQTKGNVVNKISTSSDAPVHSDLENAFQRLIPHFVLLTEEAKIDEVLETIRDDQPILNQILGKFKVTGISIGGSDDNEGVTIIGQKILGSKKVVNMNAPFQKFRDEHSSYPFENELISGILNIKQEVVLYMDGKQAEDPQTEMELQ